MRPGRYVLDLLSRLLHAQKGAKRWREDQRPGVLDSKEASLNIVHLVLRNGAPFAEKERSMSHSEQIDAEDESTPVQPELALFVRVKAFGDRLHLK